MKREEIEILCDHCPTHARLEAVVTCEAHALDLCSTHMRMHFARAACRLIPVRQEPTHVERSLDRTEAPGKGVQANFSKIEKLLRIAKGEEEPPSAEVLNCLQEDREVPPDLMELLPGKRVFLEHWNRLVKKLKDATERRQEQEGGTA
jgi:hypothetical protein